MSAPPHTNFDAYGKRNFLNFEKVLTARAKIAPQARFLRVFGRFRQNLSTNFDAYGRLGNLGKFSQIMMLTANEIENGGGGKIFEKLRFITCMFKGHPDLMSY